MTPADEWDATPDPTRLLDLLGETLTVRKARLLAVGYCRVRWAEITSAAARRHVETIEAVADGLAPDEALEGVYADLLTHTGGGADLVREAAFGAEGTGYQSRADYLRWRMRQFDFAPAVREASARVGPAPVHVHRDHPWHAAFQAAYYAALKPRADLIRCVFPNPHRPPAVLSGWRTSAAVGLARGMYDSRDFGAMPILADALQEAGCEDAAVLGHCRADAPHVRGCWVVDAVLGAAGGPAGAGGTG